MSGHHPRDFDLDADLFVKFGCSHGVSAVMVSKVFLQNKTLSSGFFLQNGLE
jgi:hypothetical protein